MTISNKIFQKEIPVKKRKRKPEKGTEKRKPYIMGKAYNLFLNLLKLLIESKEIVPKGLFFPRIPVDSQQLTMTLLDK